MRQPACRMLVDTVYGIGGLTAVAVWCELGDCRRFSRSTRWCATPDWTSPSTPPICIAPVAICPGRVRRRCAGRCSKPATYASRTGSPDHAYYTAVKHRHDGKLAAISVARQFARRCYHLLRQLDPDVVYAAPSAPYLSPATTVRVAHLNITGLCRGQLLPLPGPPALGLDGLITLTDRALPRGTPGSRLLLPTTTTFVEHPGNAGRPHAAGLTQETADMARSESDTGVQFPAAIPVQIAEYGAQRTTFDQLSPHGMTVLARSCGPRLATRQTTDRRCGRGLPADSASFAAVVLLSPRASDAAAQTVGDESITCSASTMTVTELRTSCSGSPECIVEMTNLVSP